MIEQAFAHLPTIGKETALRLRRSGILDWDALEKAVGQPGWPPERRRKISEALQKNRRALAENDPAFFIQHLKRFDHWRILDRWFDDACFFDIETADSGPRPAITVIAAFDHQLQMYADGKNLDQFLELLDACKLLVSFNGNSFDVPRVLDHFHIPALPCPHLDLRWVCWHHGYRGGLKSIEQQAGIERPDDLAGVTGADAVWLWERWAINREQTALDRLLRYCAADAVSLKYLAAVILRSHGSVCAQPDPLRLWTHLPPEPGHPPSAEKRPPAAAPEPPVQTARDRLRQALREQRRQR